jgi:cell division transport system permease protein
MNVNQGRYIVDESMLMLKRHRGANVISIVIMGLSLLILVVFILVTLNIANIIEKTTEELRVYVYLEDGIGKEDSRDIQFRLLGRRGVEEVVFISREEAIAADWFRDALGEGSGILDDLEKNPLPDAYRLKLKPGHINSAYIGELAGEIGGWEGIEEVRYGKRWFERGEKLVKGFYLADLFLGVIIVFSVIFVVSNTVRLTVLHRRRTIDVMKFVGATNTYIQVPFIIEGAFQGIAASLLAMGLSALILLFGRRYIPALVFPGVEAIAGFVCFCAVLGAFGSYGALRRHLRL